MGKDRGKTLSFFIIINKSIYIFVVICINIFMGCSTCATRNKINTAIKTKFKKKTDVLELIAKIRESRKNNNKSNPPEKPLTEK